MGPETCTHAAFLIEYNRAHHKMRLRLRKNLGLNLKFVCWLFLSCALFDAKLYRKKQK